MDQANPATRAASTRLYPGAERSLDLLSFVLSDVRHGLGAYLGVYLLTEHGWDSASIGLALSFGGLVRLVSQVPLGAMVDALRAKRALLAGAVVVATATCFMIPLAPCFWPVAAAGVIGGLAGTVVGPSRFAHRAGRNEALFHLGNGVINVAILATASFIGTPVIFWMMGLTAVASVAAAAAVPERAIDHAVARGFRPDDVQHGVRPSAWSTLLTSRPLLVFAVLSELAPASIAGALERAAGSIRPLPKMPSTITVRWRKSILRRKAGTCWLRRVLGRR